jgi:hypothetical protein
LRELLSAYVRVAIDLAVRKAGSFSIAVGVGTVGIAAAAFGYADDAPGLVLLGMAMTASALALGVRLAQRRHQ